MMKKFMLALVCVTLLVSVACASEVVKAYTTMEEPLAKALFDEFEAETGIKVEWVRLSGGEAIARLEAERQNYAACLLLIVRESLIAFRHVIVILKIIGQVYMLALQLSV